MAEELKNIPEPDNEICKGCLRWERFEKKCSVYWQGKKWCTFKVNTIDEWREQEKMLGQRIM